jgi:hypothetical protein
MTVTSSLLLLDAGTFAETAIIGYCLSFAHQRKHMSVFRFRLQQQQKSLLFPFLFEENKWMFLFSISSVYCLWNSVKLQTWTWRNGDMET